MPKSRNYLSYAKRYAPYFMAFVVSLLLLSFLKFSTFDINNSTDSSWQYSLSGLRHSDQTLGEDIFYTYGPLFQVMPTYVHENDSLLNFVVGNTIFIYLLFVFAYVVINASKKIGKHLKNIDNKLLVLGVGLVGLISLTDIDTVFNILLLLGLYVGRSKKSYWVKSFILSGLYLLAFYKFSYFLPVIVLTPVVFIKNIDVRQVIRALCYSLPIYLMSFFAYSVLTWSFTILGYFKFLYYSTINTAYYNEFMVLPYRENLFFVLLFLFVFYIAVASAITVILSPSINKRFKNFPVIEQKIPVALSLSFLLVAFLDLKHAIVRSDIHLLSFTPFVFLCGAFVYVNLKPALKKQPGSDNLALVLLILLTIFVHFITVAGLLKTSALDTANIMKNISTATIKQATLNSRFNYKNYTKLVRTSKESIDIRGDHLRDIRTKINTDYPGKPIIFYGNTNLLGEYLARTSKVMYMPYLQNYVAYPPQIGNKLYIEYLENNPDALVFAEEVEPSIDKRVPAYELNDFHQYLTHNYEPVVYNQDPLEYFFVRKSSDVKKCQDLEKFVIKDNAVINMPELPELKEGQYINLVASKKLSVVEKVVSFLAKGPVGTVTLLTPESIGMKVRVPESTLEEGITIEPLNQSLRDFVTQKPFDMKTLTIHDGFPVVKSEYSVSLQLCSYSSPPGS